MKLTSVIESKNHMNSPIVCSRISVYVNEQQQSHQMHLILNEFGSIKLCLYSHPILKRMATSTDISWQNWGDWRKVDQVSVHGSVRKSSRTFFICKVFFMFLKWHRPNESSFWCDCFDFKLCYSFSIYMVLQASFHSFYLLNS